MPEITDGAMPDADNQFDHHSVSNTNIYCLVCYVLAWFKAQGKGYQTRMNEILRDAHAKRIKKHQKNGLRFPFLTSHKVYYVNFKKSKFL